MMTASIRPANSTSHKFAKNLLISPPFRRSPAPLMLSNSPQQIVSRSFLGLKFRARQAFEKSGVGSATRVFDVSCGDIPRVQGVVLKMPFQLPDLPFAKDALAPHMSAETLEYHHGKHHKAYVNKTNELVQSESELSGA